MAKEIKVTAEQKIEMSLEEAKAYRAALSVPVTKKLTEVQKREAFRVYWAGNKSRFGRSRDLENALWMHLKAIGMDHPTNFEKGIFNFGVKPEKTKKKANRS